jgi:hypothetical protein
MLGLAILGLATTGCTPGCEVTHLSLSQNASSRLHDEFFAAGVPLH